MASRHRSLQAAFSEFTEELNAVLRSTITTVPVIAEPVFDQGVRSFSFGADGYAELRAERFGKLWLFLGQVCDSSVEHGVHTLHTRSYSYGIGPAGQPKPTIRWDYEREWPPGKCFCRHHFQGSPEIGLGTDSFELDEFHTPTGYVAVEDIIRFCIDDLGVPSASGGWHKILQDSYRGFRSKMLSHDGV
jgi:hypothetical protein